MEKDRTSPRLSNIPDWAYVMKRLSDMGELFGFDPSPRLASYWELATKEIGKPIGFNNIETMKKAKGNPLRLPGNSPRGITSMMPGDPMAVVLLNKELLTGCPPQDIEAVAAHELAHLRLTARGFWGASVEPSPRYMVDSNFSPYVVFSSTLEDVVVNRVIVEEGFDALGGFQEHLDGIFEMVEQSDYPGREPWDQDYHMLCSVCILLQMTSRRLRCVETKPELLDMVKKAVERRSPKTWQWYMSILDHLDEYDLRDPAQHNACLVWLSRQLKAAPRVRFFHEDSFKKTQIPDSVVDEAAKIAPARRS